MDTNLKIEGIQINLVRRMPSWKKAGMVDALNRSVKDLARSGIKQRHPGASSTEIKFMLAEQMLGKELALKVYGHAR